MTYLKIHKNMDFNLFSLTETPIAPKISTNTKQIVTSMLVPRNSKFMEKCTPEILPIEVQEELHGTIFRPLVFQL